MKLQIQNKSLKWAIDELNKMNDLDFVVFLGDNIEKSNKESLKSFLNIVNSLNKPYYLVLGNQDAHKIAGITKDEYIDVVLNYNKNQKAFSSNYMFIPKKE
ncbi:MAG: metallophosphoesterase [Candidatus Melainabacteria bacterium]|nr:MAG: metallophosphoesterase [Candidatus Melainabacteria bacterium]